MSKIYYWESFNAENYANFHGISTECAKGTNCNSLSYSTEGRFANLCKGTQEHGQKPWDVTETSNGDRKIEVRNMDAKISFAPSTATGKGRFFENKTFQHKLSSIGDGIFALCDIRPFKYPENYDVDTPRFYQIPAELIRDLYDMGVLGKTAHIDTAVRKVYRGDWKRLMRFDELFPWDESSPFCGYGVNNSMESYPSAREIVQAAVSRIEKNL